jgi:hypothetical protein
MPFRSVYTLFTPAPARLRYRLMSAMFTKELHQQGHTRKFSVSERRRDGWEVRDEQDDHLLKHVVYTDWHRVERAMSVFNLQIDELESRGWASR